MHKVRKRAYGSNSKEIRLQNTKQIEPQQKYRLGTISNIKLLGVTGRVPTVREKSGKKVKKIKVREKSGNFEISQGNLKKWQKSGKSQGISESEEEILK